MAQLLKATTHDIGGIEVKRLLPHMKKRMVGPFIFFDRMGPSHFPQGRGIEVKPHPHIGLSTLTYLIEGKVLHRDSLGNQLEIAPGDVNWMTAGKGIVHSERESFETRGKPHHIDGLQSWVALPKAYADIAPSFEHINRDELPQSIQGGIMKRVIAGHAYGLTSPIRTYSPLFYVDIIATMQNTLDLPSDTQETAIYIIFGALRIDDVEYNAGDLVLIEDLHSRVITLEDSRVILLGGDKWDSVPYIHWNFVSFSKARIDQAKLDWENGHFPAIPDDNLEFVPLPTRK
ncbi:pirin family protein [Pseudoalteromonas sp. SMS1]|uniref:pirin family protein n=1 Tax=Pseudoalteromonas sp. SMS1 TaxID=2908894 RepID=UPI001F184B23|nr:pirin family protein [Pseudoalteromonas sp. SMS1]MCF2859998.1 pirin family protein [Pseudoalteromonas sp. SMS1]